MPSVMTIAKKSLGWSIALSILMIITGILAMAAPEIAGVAVTVVVAWLLVISGIGHLLFAWHARGAGALIFEILLAVVYLWTGVYIFMQPLAGLVALTLVLAIYLFAEGILETFLAFRFRPHPGWGWLLFDGLITLVLAVMIWRHWPSSSLWVIGLLVGISMFLSGLTRLMFSVAARGVVSAAG